MATVSEFCKDLVASRAHVFGMKPSEHLFDLDESAIEVFENMLMRMYAKDEILLSVQNLNSDRLDEFYGFSNEYCDQKFKDFYRKTIEAYERELIENQCLDTYMSVILGLQLFETRSAILDLYKRVYSVLLFEDRSRLRPSEAKFVRLLQNEQDLEVKE